MNAHYNQTKYAKVRILKKKIVFQKGQFRLEPEVAKSLSGSPGGSIDVHNTSKLKHLLGNPSGHNPSSTRRRNHPYSDGATFPGDLAGHGVGQPDLVTPVTPPHRDHRELSQYDCATYGGGHLLAALDPEADVAISVADDDEGLEPGSLTGPGLLLDGHDLHDLVLEAGAHEGIDDLVLLDGEGVEVDLLEG
ncbi:LOW QUALITY PROTEIN: hypothetical protein PanWU01x14_224260 [Parasponia andersonii]|uniref:Uncharacterized protein n=1 Tax=Parasponia andersonii TaxID=3476 RepID=A0A2P5BN93_PARAD|nr:LOW QUALITY PROTEIN: hypothetical protein PanWU01x14_224260 [Parasponia andersonii]